MAGVATACVSCVIFGQLFFDIKWWMSVLAVAITFILSVVAARATGETDITPIGAMGKITQLTYGVIAPTNITTNLMTASITAGAASQSADLLTDLKAGYLVGTNPRLQTIAQFFGVLAGVLVCVPIYTIIVRTPVFDPNTPTGQVASQGTKTGSSVDSVKGDADSCACHWLSQPPSQVRQRTIPLIICKLIYLPRNFPPHRLPSGKRGRTTCRRCS